jgi:HAE1 family hydrophobic/amphiphilic exporter-1
MKLSEFCIRKPITTMMVALSAVVLGLISLTKLPLNSTPNIAWPSMWIFVPYASSSPEEVDRLITRPIEGMMGTLTHVKRISSTSGAVGSSRGSSSGSGGAQIRLEFDYGTDMDMMAVDVRDRLDQVRPLLPPDVERINVRRWQSDDWPILEVSVTWKGDREEFRRVVEKVIQPRLERINGVANVAVEGLEKKQLLVKVDQGLMQAHNVDIRTLNWNLRANNVTLSAGTVDDGGKRYAVRSVGEFRSVEELASMPIIRRDVVLSDVAHVVYDYPEKRRFERLDGADAVVLEVRKSSTANLVEVAGRVQKALGELREEFGERLTLYVVRDRSRDVVRGLNSLKDAGLLGGTLAIAIIFAFMRSLRSTVIIGAAIPLSVVCVFMGMYLARVLLHSEITLNMVSMMGLMIAIGMLVDPAVVVLENIFRKREEGTAPVEAATAGTSEVALPILAGTLTTCCVFVPLVFVTDSQTALWMKDFCVTMVIAMITAMVVSVTLVPLAASRLFEDRYAHVGKWIGVPLIGASLLYIGLELRAVGWAGIVKWVKGTAAGVAATVQGMTWGGWAATGTCLALAAVLVYELRRYGLKGFYARAVGKTLHYRMLTLVFSLLVGGYSVYYIGWVVEKQGRRWEQARRVEITVELSRSFDISQVTRIFEEVERVLIAKKKDLDIQRVSSRFGLRNGRIALYLVDADKGRYTSTEVTNMVKKLLPQDRPGVRFKMGGSYRSESIGVGVEVRGKDPDVLALLAEDVKLRMEGIQGVLDLDTSLESGTEEIRVSVDRRRASRYGMSPWEVASSVSSALGTRGSSKFKTGDEEIDIVVQLREEDRANLEQLKNATFEGQAGNRVAFGTLADFRLQKGPQALRREDRRATVTVFASTDQAAIASVGREMARRMGQVALPAGYTWQMSSSFRYIQEAQGESSFTMLFAAVLIYLIMASLFESFVQPFAMMISIPFAYTGVALAMYGMQIPMDSNGQIGLLVLFGVVVCNGIVLINHINDYRREGLDRGEAIIRGGQDRVRPILITASTTVLSLMPLVLPMIFGAAEGYAKQWGQIALVVVSGLITSTPLTLVIAPTIYALLDDLAAYARRVFVAVAQGEGAA